MRSKISSVSEQIAWRLAKFVYYMDWLCRMLLLPQKIVIESFIVLSNVDEGLLKIIFLKRPARKPMVGLGKSLVEAQSCNKVKMPCCWFPATRRHCFNDMTEAETTMGGKRDTLLDKMRGKEMDLGRRV